MSTSELQLRVQTALLGDQPRGSAHGSDHWHPACRPDLHGDLPGIPAALGRALRRVHTAIPAAELAELGLGDLWNDLACRVNERVTSGELTAANLPEPYDRYDIGELVELWAASRPPTTEMALCVGEATMENLLMVQGEVVGCSSLADAGIADRHLDLARLQLSIQEHLGSEAVFGFYEAYGSDPGLVSLDHYVLANHLLVDPPKSEATR